MYRDKKRYGQDPTVVTRSTKGTFLAPLTWQREVEAGTRGGTARLVFTCSWSDFFIEEADAWRPEVWDIMRQTPGLIYQILSKRPERFAAQLPDDWGEGWPHVWLGVSCENQRTLHRLKTLCATPAAVRFASFEPLLEDVGDLTAWLGAGGHAAGLAQCIIGGESGPRARECDVAWIRSIVQQCHAAGVAVFVKQLGSAAYDTTQFTGARFIGYEQKDYVREIRVRTKHRNGADPAEFPADLRVQAFPQAVTP